MRWSAKTREEILSEIKRLSKELEVSDSNHIDNQTGGMVGNGASNQTLDHLNLVGMTVERNGIISYCNSFTFKVLGWQKHEILGKNFFEFLVPKYEQQARWEAFQLALEKGGIFENSERTILSKSGSVVYLALNSVINNTENDMIQAITLVGEDVTEKRKTDLILARRNEQLDDLVANTSDLIQILSMRGKILFVNATWKEVLGYTDEDLSNLNIRDLIHPEFLEKTLAILQKIENGERIADVETVFRKKNGRRIYLSGSINCRIENGKPVAFRCILHDATAKVRAEKAQQLYYSIATSASESKNLDALYYNIHEELGKVIDVKNFFIALYDASYLHFPYYVDEAFESQVRFTKRKLGNGLTEYAIMANQPLFLTDTDIHALADSRKIYLYGQVPKCMLCAPLRIGDRLTGIIGVKSYERTNKYDIRDLQLLEFISGQVALAIERKQSEEFLNKQRARLQAIFESSSHLMWSVNKRLLLTSFNQNYHDFIQDLLKVSPQINFSPEKLAWRMVNPENRKILENHYKLALKGETQHFEIQFESSNKNEELWYEIFLNPILLNDGNIEEVSGIARDISNLKKFSEETIKAKEEAEHSLKVKERFLANMSHEIRTPMNGVIGMVDMLSDTPLNIEQNKYVQTIKKSSETLLNILNDILDLSKIEAGKMELHDAPLSIKDMLEKLIALFGQTAYNKGNELFFSMQADIPAYIIADETRLLQMVSNLTSNAIKFTENGKIEIKVSKISQTGRFHKLKIEVIDSGVGISQKNLDLLFNAFVQVDSSFTKSAGGTGLGLAITKSIAQLMKGETGVRSEVGKGSSFWVTFEVKETSIAPSQQKIGQGEFHVHDFLISYQPRLLLVDDNAVNRTVASEILRKAGCVIDTADGGKKALEMVKSNIEFSEKRYDLILMDIQMPEMDGIETTQRLRQAHQTLPPVLAMTAYSMKEDRERFLSEGLDDYIAKPIRAESLCKKVKEWLERNQSNQSKQSSKLQQTEAKNIEVNAENNYPVFDEEIISQLIEMAGKEMVESVYQDFENEAIIQLKECAEAWQTQDYKTIKGHLHTLKGNAGTIGLAQLHEALKTLELKAKIDDFETYNQQMPMIEQAFLEFQKTYQSFLKSK